MTPTRLPRLGSVAWAELEDANGFGKVRPVVVVSANCWPRLRPACRLRRRLRLLGRATRRPKFSTAHRQHTLPPPRMIRGREPARSLDDASTVMTEDTIWRQRKVGGAHPTRKDGKFNFIDMERANYRTHPLFDPRGVSSTRGGHRVFSFERRDRAEHEPACIIQVECEESLVIYPVERQGLSLADLAERTKLDPATLANREAGRIPNPTLRALRAYAHALGKQLSWTIQEPVPTT